MFFVPRRMLEDIQHHINVTNEEMGIVCTRLDNVEKILDKILSYLAKLLYAGITIVVLPLLYLAGKFLLERYFAICP
jgi:hypothetical protein